MTEISVSFRVMSKELAPEVVTEALNLTPSQAHRRGDPHFGPSGARYSDYSEGLWSLRSQLPRTAPLDEHLASLAEVLVSRAAAVRTLALEHRLDLFIGVFGDGTGNFGFGISGEVLQSLAQLGVPLGFDVYEVNSDEPETREGEPSGP